MFNLYDNLLRRINEEKLSGVQLDIKSYNTPSLELTPSTWSGEEQWYKFIILSDGSVIPVKSSHMETIANVDLDDDDDLDYDDDDDDPDIRIDSDILDEFDESGGLQGRIDHKMSEMDVYYEKITAAQINSLKKLWNKYGCKELILDSPRDIFRPLSNLPSSLLWSLSMVRRWLQLLLMNALNTIFMTGCFGSVRPFSPMDMRISRGGLPV